MQHRRTKENDDYGVFEPVNDLDQFGKGIQTRVTYHMLIHDTKVKNINNSTDANNSTTSGNETESNMLAQKAKKPRIQEPE
jgi:hypothetical protein